MELVGAAAVIETVETTSTYFTQDVPTTATMLGNLAENVINITRAYSPITLNRNWSWIWRLFFMLLFTGAGTIVNIFFIASFFISQQLKQKGNIFLACTGFTDMLITTFVVPTAIVILMSDSEETNHICRTLQFLTQSSTYAYSVFYMLVSIDYYGRVVYLRMRYIKYLTYPIGLLAFLNYCFSIATAGAGIYYDLDSDYCNRTHFGNFWFRLVTSIVFYLLPFVTTCYFLINTSCILKDRVDRLVRHRRWHIHKRNLNMANLLLAGYTLFVASWIPSVVLLNLYPDTTDAMYYLTIWIGLIRSALTGLLFSIINENFRSAFHVIVMYCCCKRSAIRQRHINNGARERTRVRFHSNCLVLLNENPPVSSITAL